MPQSLAKILVQTVFSTKDRRPFLRDRSLREECHAYVGGILVNLECQPLIVGGVEDHVHWLCALARTRPPAKVVKEPNVASGIEPVGDPTPSELEQLTPDWTQGRLVPFCPGEPTLGYTMQTLWV